MDIINLAQDGLKVIQDIQPGLEAAAKATTALGTVGSAVVSLLQKGKRLYTYLIAPRRDESEEADAVLSDKEDVAILVDINRRMLHDVARYLASQEIDASLVIVTNDRQYSDQVQFLGNDPEEWEELVGEFNSAANIIKRATGSANLHIFLSTPLALTFGLGSVWGTVDRATIYHWDGNTYQPVMPISRRLRQ